MRGPLVTFPMQKEKTYIDTEIVAEGGCQIKLGPRDLASGYPASREVGESPTNFVGRVSYEALFEDSKAGREEPRCDTQPG